MKVTVASKDVKCPICGNDDFANLYPTKVPEYDIQSKSINGSLGHGHELKPVKCTECGYVLFFGDFEKMQII